MIKNNYFCKLFGHNFQNYKKIKEDNRVEYREGYCKKCGQKDIYINSVYD